MANKKIKEAAALRYRPDEGAAPRIIASGKGYAAGKIVETAKKSDIPVYEDAKLAHELSSMFIGEEIPQELYEIVAEIMVFVAGIDKEYGETNG